MLKLKALNHRHRSKMEVTPKEVQFYETPDGKCPSRLWLDSLRDRDARARILVRIRRVEQGNLGNYLTLGKGVGELKIDYGPGYRVYFGQVGSTVVLILCGGNKSTQESDILKAQEYWEEYGNRQKT